MNEEKQEPCELGEIVFEKPLSGAFEEVLFGSDKGNTLWVKFSDITGVNEWIGKFGVGSWGPERVFKVAEPDRFFVSAGGFAYLIDATERKLVGEYHGRNARDVTYDCEKKLFIAADWARLHGIDLGGEILFSREIAVDGIRDLKIEGRILSGLATSNYGGEEEKFRFDLDELKILSWERVAPKDARSSKPWWKI